MLVAEDLLAGSKLSFNIEIPSDVLMPRLSTDEARDVMRNKLSVVKMCPLTLADLQRISHAAKENDSLLGVLMVQKSLQEPEMSVVEVSSLHLGLMQFLLQQVNDISGLNMESNALRQQAQDPVAKAAFLLAQEFGWSPQQISELTLGEIMLHLEMMSSRKERAG